MAIVQRFTYQPGTDVLTQIEGVKIIDLPVPGAIAGQGTGVACCVGEFADMTYATAVDTSGNVTTLCQPQEVFSSSDLVAKFGGFDEAIGDFGKSNGNGYIKVKGKAFQRLIIAAVNLCSAKGMRFFRELPLNTSATNTLPVVPVSGGTISAGAEFRSGAARVRIGKTVSFTALAPIATGIGGATVAGSSAATQVFDATAGFDWTTVARSDGTVGTHKGDILVIGYNTAGARTPTSEAGTYRVASDPSSGVAVTLERLDGANFTFTAQTTVSWRLHVSSDADSAPVTVPGAATPGGYAAADAGGYTVPVRALTDSNGAQVLTTSVAAGGTVLPVVAQAAATGSSWSPLSALEGRVNPGFALDFTAGVQAPNAVASSAIDALYVTALAATISRAQPMNAINIIFAARTSSTIRSNLVANANTASGTSKGRRAILSPDLSVVTTTAIVAATDPGVGANRAERGFYSAPGGQLYALEAVGFKIKGADGVVYTNGIIDETADAWLASLCSMLNPENNPAQLQDPVPQLMQSCLGFQRNAPQLQIGDYIALRANGVCALDNDETVGMVFQSGVTTSLVPGQTNINRRQMADYIEDNLAQIAKLFSKATLSVTEQDNCVGEMVSFLDGLLGVQNPSTQRIAAYSIDDKSGNSPNLAALNIFVVQTVVKMLQTGDFIVLQTQVGTNVTIPQAL